MSIQYFAHQHFTTSYLYYQSRMSTKQAVYLEPQISHEEVIKPSSRLDLRENATQESPFYFKNRESGYGIVFSDGKQWILGIKDNYKIKHKTGAKSSKWGLEKNPISNTEQIIHKLLTQKTKKNSVSLTEPRKLKSDGGKTANKH